MCSPPAPLHQPLTITNPASVSLNIHSLSMFGQHKIPVPNPAQEPALTLITPVLTCVGGAQGALPTRHLHVQPASPLASATDRHQPSQTSVLLIIHSLSMFGRHKLLVPKPCTGASPNPITPILTCVGGVHQQRVLAPKPTLVPALTPITPMLTCVGGGHQQRILAPELRVRAGAGDQRLHGRAHAALLQLAAHLLAQQRVQHLRRARAAPHQAP